MDARWLARNVSTAWTEAATLFDFAKKLAFDYSHLWPRWPMPGQFEVTLRYPVPVGLVRLRLRCNKGADAFIASEVFGHRYYDVPLARTPRTVLDLGANAGFTAVWFGRRFPAAEIACVEPMAGNVRSLERNLELNDIRARAFPAAIDAVDGFVAMESASRDWGHRVAVKQGSPAGWNDSAVPAVSVPTVMKQMGWSSIDLVKVDIEGHEKTLFSENVGWVRAVNGILIEWHHPRAREDLQAIADAHGMRPPRQLPGIWFLEREHWV